MKREVKNVPALRFPEFDGEWGIYKLGDLIASMESGISVNSEDFPAPDNGGYGVLKTSCISSGSFTPKENKQVVPDDISRAKLNPTRDSIIVSRMNTPQLVGESGYVYDDFPNLFLPDRLWLIKTKKDVNAKWLSLVLISSKVKVALTNIATGTSGSMKNIAQPNFLKIATLKPSLPEQQKIASFLTAVDDKIQQLSKKKALLEQYKKGVMQQLFSQKLRFKDDQGNAYPDWEEKTLGDIGEIVTGKTPSTNDPKLWGGDIQFITPTDIMADNKYQVSTVRTVSKTKGMRILPVNSILFTCIASIGKMALSIKPCITNQQINSIVPKTSYSNEFVYYAILQMVEYIKSTQANTTLPIINKTEFSKFRIQIPLLTEQTKIASFLSAIDDKINSVNQQIEHTRQFKKGLLQQMFV